MNCTEFQNRLNAIWDARQSPEGDPLLADHMDACADCRQLVETQMAIFTHLPLDRVPEMSSGAVDRILDAVREDRAADTQVLSFPVSPRIATWGSAAAIVVVAVTVYFANIIDDVTRPTPVAEVQGSSSADEASPVAQADVEIAPSPGVQDRSNGATQVVDAGTSAIEADARPENEFVASPSRNLAFGVRSLLTLIAAAENREQEESDLDTPNSIPTGVFAGAMSNGFDRMSSTTANAFGFLDELAVGGD